MPVKQAVETVTWSEWDDKLRSYQHKTLRGPLFGDHGEVFRPGEIGDVPDEVIARIEKIRDQEFADHASGRYVNHRAGRVRLVDPEEYEEHFARAAVAAEPQNRFMDDEIRSWDASTAVAQMNQVPGLAQRVKDLEEKRPYTRKQVVAHCDRVLDAEQGRDVSLKPADE